MAPFPKIKNLCTPAFVYFSISILALLIVFFQNIGHTNSYHMGNFSCRVPHTGFVFLFKLIYIFFWTYVIHLICKDGHKALSWFLVLFPFLLLFVIIGLMLLNF